MKKNIFIISNLILLTLLFSCNNKKLTEVVEVPLPTARKNNYWYS